MPDAVREIDGIRLLECGEERAPLHDYRGATDLIAAAWACEADWIIVPVQMLDGSFFRLRTGVAGEIVGKFVLYKAHVAIIGDISAYEDASTAFRDFVRESNRAPQVWFLRTLEDFVSIVAQRSHGRR